MFTIAVIINPNAGLGGRAALKGSDHPDTVAKASGLGVKDYVWERVELFIDALCEFDGQICIVTPSAQMGVTRYADRLEQAGHTIQVIRNTPEVTTPVDTMDAVNQAINAPLDLLVFAGAGWLY